MRVLAAFLVALAVLPVAAVHANDGIFEFGRLVRQTPDAHRRIGVTVHCVSTHGCKLELILSTTGAGAAELGRVYTQVIGGTTEVDYVLLTKRKLAVIAKRSRTKALFTANVSSGGVTSTYTKPVTLQPPKRTRSR